MTDIVKMLEKVTLDYETRHSLTELCSEAADEIIRLRAERDEARADALALAAERNNWQSMYQDAMAERDEALKLLREANNWIGRDCTNVREQIAELTPLCNRIDAALKGAK